MAWTLCIVQVLVSMVNFNIQIIVLMPRELMAEDFTKYNVTQELQIESSRRIHSYNYNVSYQWPATVDY